MASIALLWLPVGAGGHVVIHTSKWWESIDAWRRRRRPQRLVHAALEVRADGIRYLIEMTPAWGVPATTRGVVATGPVGSRWVGRSRFFRYEVRCWRDGILPDREWAIAAPVSFPLTEPAARSLLARVATVPSYVWGRDPLRCGDMWNSNSLVSWLLSTSGFDATQITPPIGTRAPGWVAGIAAATTTQDPGN